MQIKAVIGDRYQTMEIHVCNEKMNEEVEALISDLNKYVNSCILGKNVNGDTVQIDLKDVVSFYSEGTKNYARTSQGAVSIAKKLYELDEELDNSQFIRISRSEIVNLKKIKKLDMSITGSIRVYLSDGSETYTSRRNVTKLKKALGI